MEVCKKKRCIIVREETEWVELVKNNFAEITGSNVNKLLEAFNRFQKSTANFSLKLYGNNVGEKIYQEILQL